MESFRDLIVWQRAMELVVKTYGKISALPKNEEYGLAYQIRKAAVSIPSNIAEGYGRRSTGDYIRFLQISLGSLYELQTQLEISRRLSFLKDADCHELNGICEEVSKMLISLTDKISQHNNHIGA
ncbi:MAG TPA: four helix bundle protein [Lentisphaeria bacterium]|nr:MAG: four helix bundle protein [Lentisphaerae bacterium GWF2_49_21]HBC86685.1 four helix bundle protein [Lentisphaeria bacterium]